MALEEEPSSAGQEMRPAVDCMRNCADLAGVDASTLDQLAAGAMHFSLPAGSSLFEKGSISDGVYLLVSGRLGVRTAGNGPWEAEIAGGELVGEAGWLLNQPRGASVVALRDSELLLMPNAVMEEATGRSPAFSMAMARLCARRLHRSNRSTRALKRAWVFVIVPNNDEIDVAELATRLVTELARSGSAELVWDVRASTHTSAWFHRIEELNDFVVCVANPVDSGWTRQCCRQADVILLAARARATPTPWPASISDAAIKRGARIELALLHDGSFAAGAATRWLELLPVTSHHHVVDYADLGRVARLLTHRGVGLVLSGGGARGFAHLGVIRALREARIPIDFVGGVSIGAIIAAGVAMGWSDEEMRLRYRRCFVDTNPVNDYTFPWVALTRGRKVSRLLEREYGNILIEDLRQPYFCISANLVTGRAFEHREGSLPVALRASVALPGVMPPVFRGGDILVDGAAINNLPVDVMQRHTPGLVIGSDVAADRGQCTRKRLNIFSILMYAGLVNSAATAAAQRSLADVLLKPPLAKVDLLNWQAFDRAIEAGYTYAQHALADYPELPRMPATVMAKQNVSSLSVELEKRVAATVVAD
ncbi:MAG TPA: patatin-like phospholipase family protein [Steroidobacteraceae bacterium]|nr:patatin-like phospholipase family protein [Steroidobacteraceae bacterium]